MAPLYLVTLHGEHSIAERFPVALVTNSVKKAVRTAWRIAAFRFSEGPDEHLGCFIHGVLPDLCAAGRRNAPASMSPVFTNELEFETTKSNVIPFLTGTNVVAVLGSPVPGVAVKFYGTRTVDLRDRPLERSVRSDCWAEVAPIKNGYEYV